jgi:type IV secretory pathway TraG/TraD family ATPase VirD4
MLRLGITPALLLLCAAVCLGQSFDAPESQSEADAKSSAQDQVYNEYLKQQLAKGLVSPEEFQKQSDYHAGWIARRRAKWANTPYIAIYDKAFKRALIDPAYRRPLPDDAFPAVPPKPKQDSGDGRYGLGWWIAVGGFGAYLVLVWRYGGGKTPPEPKDERPPLSDNFGTARFALPQTAITGLKDFGGIFLGKSSSPLSNDLENAGIPVCSTPKSHVLIVAQTQTGKGTRILIPSLLKNLHSSFLVIDPKGENAAVTARARSATNHVHIVNPWGAYADTFQQLGFLPATYNPLDMLDRNDPNVVAIAKAISAAICPSAEGKGKDTFWTATPARLLTAILLWLIYEPREIKTLARARAIASLSRKDFTEKYLTKMAACSAFSGAIRDNAAPFIDLADDTYSGLLSNLGTFTDFLSDPQVQAATASSSFSMNDLTGAGMDRPTTVYFVTADTGEAQTWLRLMIWAATYTFKRKPKGARLRCNFLLDEFANLGYLKEMPKDISLVAGSGIDYTLIVQGLDQLKDVYGDARGTIIGNCRYKWFCNVDDLDSAEYLSKYLGKYTVGTVNTGKSEGQTIGPNGRAQEGKSTNFGEMGKDLLSPDQILQLGKNAAILLETGTLPQYIRPVDYWDLPKAFAGLKDSCPHLFWDPPLQWDQNPNSSIQQTPVNGAAAPRKPFDYGHYSPGRSAEKEREAPPQKAPEQKAEEKPSGWNYNPQTYAPKGEPEAPPKPPRTPKGPDGSWDLETGKFEPFRPKKPRDGGDK